MNDDILELKDELIADMTEYMEHGDADDEEDEAEDDPDFDPGYTEEHVERCGEILDEYFAELSQVPGTDPDEEIMDAVRKTVLALNKLNEDSGGNLIETEQREQLCEIISAAAQEAGLDAQHYDITEEWREW